MAERTPTTENVRAEYIDARYDPFDKEHKYEDSGAEFDRWLKEHDRQTAEAAWDAGHNHCFHVENPKNREKNPHRERNKS